MEHTKNYCEPRVLWETFSVVPNAPGNQVDLQSNYDYGLPNGRARGVPTYWRNGQKNPIVLQGLLLSGFGYVLDEANVAASDIVTFDNCRAAALKVDLFVSAPYRQHFSWRDVPVRSWRQEPISEPSMRYASAGLGFAGIGHASGLLGLSRWDFDFGLDKSGRPNIFWLPARSGIQFELSTWTVPVAAPMNPSAASVNAAAHAVSFWETADNYSEFHVCSNRLKQRAQLLSAAAVGASVWYPSGPAPLPFDEFSAQTLAGSSAQVFPGAHMFTAAAFKAQNPNIGNTHTNVGGYAVALDQIAFDDDISADLVAAGSTGILAPFASRVITRAKVASAGTDAWWWRPGAPLSLVSPSVGCGMRHVFDEPIILAPGDSLSVEVQSPAATTLPNGSTINPTYKLGVSAYGYSQVEG